MRNEHEASIVRVFSPDNDVIGTGFLVTEHIVLTCAHVIADALNCDRYTSNAPTATIHLDFPIVAPGHLLAARILSWQPLLLNGVGDIAVLELDSLPPQGTSVAHLFVEENLWGHDFQAFGFPKLHDNGVWASGKLRGREATGWVQIEDVKETGHRVQPGFSGGAVWDEQLDGVVGMVVAADDLATKAAYMIPTKVLIEACPELNQQAILSNPYRGLFAFREQDAPYFFGREIFIDQLIEAVRRQSMTLILGSSGSGKSSVIFAGLFSHLRPEQSWQIAHFRPGSRPFHALAAALIPLLESTMSEVDQLVEINKLAELLRHKELTLRDVVERILKKYSTSLLLVVDQFEELYTLCAETDIRLQFLDALLDIAGNYQSQQNFCFTLIFALRADFLGQAIAHHSFADVCQKAMLILKPMTRDQLKEVIEKPAQKEGVTFAPGLIERILSDVESEPGNLPLLEFALTLLWNQQEKKQLTHHAYEVTGGVKGALIHYADQVYEDLKENEKDQMRRVLVQMIRPGEDTADTRRVTTRAELGEDGWTMARRLSDKRLVVTTMTADGQEAAEIVHEALLQTWEPLRTWMNTDRVFREWQERFRLAIRQWTEKDDDAGALLHGALLTEATGWLERRGEEFGAREKTYLGYSILYRGESRSIRDWQQHYGTTEDTLAFLNKYRDELDEEKCLGTIEALKYLPSDNHTHNICVRLQQFVLEDISNRVSTQAAIALCERGNTSCLTNLLSRKLRRQEKKRLVQTLVAIRNVPRIGFEMQMHAESPVVSSRALSKLFSSYKVILLTIFVFSCILGQLTLLFTKSIISIPILNTQLYSSVDPTIFIIDVFWISITLTVGTLWLIRRSLIDGKALSIKDPPVIGTALILSVGVIEPYIVNSSLLLPYNQSSILNLSSNIQFIIIALCYLIGAFMRMSVVAMFLWIPLSSRGSIWKLFLIAALYATVEILFHYNIFPQFILLNGEISHLSFTGIWLNILKIISNHIYIVRTDGPTYLTMFIQWILGLSAAFGCFLGPRIAWILAHRFLHSRLSTLLITQLASTRQTALSQIHLSSADLISQALGPNDTRKSSRSTKAILQYTIAVSIICVGLVIMGLGTFWYVQHRLTYLPDAYRGHSDVVDAVAWSPDGTHIASAGRDKTVQVWDAATGDKLLIYRGHSDVVRTIAWSPDGTRIASAGDDKTVQVWDVATGSTLLTYRGHSDVVRTIAWSPDGTRIASAGDDKTVQVWDVATGKMYSSHHFRVDNTYTLTLENMNNAIAWSPDSTRIVMTTYYNAGVSIIVLDATSSKTIATFSSKTDLVLAANQIAWSIDGKHIIWGTNVFESYPTLKEGIWVQVRDAISGRILANDISFTNILAPPFGASQAFSFSGDMTRIALVAGTFVCVWHLPLNDGFYIYAGHTQGVVAVAWSPDNSRIASGGVDKTVQIWQAA